MLRIFFLASAIALFNLHTIAQINSVVINSTTRQTIPFAHIGVKDTSAGFTTSETGQFCIANNNKSYGLVCLAPGFKTRFIAPEFIGDTIWMDSEAQVKETNAGLLNKYTKTWRVGESKKENVKSFFGASKGNPVVVARFFPTDKTNSAAFIKQVNMVTHSFIGAARFNLLLFTKGNNAEPDEWLCNENMICTAKEGTGITTIDLASKHIVVPANGFYVAVQWLALPSNEYSFQPVKKNDDLILVNLEPSVGFVQAVPGTETWIFTGDRWMLFNQYRDSFGINNNKNRMPAIEVVLTD